MNKFLIFAAFLLSANFCAFAQTDPPEDDVQFWNETTVSAPLLKKKDENGKDVEKIGVFVFGNLRVGRNVSRPVDERIGAGLDFYVNKYLTFSPSYLYSAAQPYKGRKEFEHRVRFDLTAGKSWSKFSIKDRNRVEYRIRHSRSDSVRYRNRITLSVPVKKDDKEIFTPFVADEVYYDFSEKEWSRNEFSAGISKKFNKNYSADFFYLLRNNTGNVLKRINVFGVNLKIKID
jgi:hypothetical protein